MKMNKKIVIFGLVTTAMVSAGALMSVALMSSKDVEVSDAQQGDETFKNIGVEISTGKNTYAQGENISGNFTLINGRNETIYLAGYPSYHVDILSKSMLKPVCPSKDFAAIMILLHIPVSSHSKYNIYSPCVFYTIEQNNPLPQGEYIIRISFSVSLNLAGDSNNIDTYSGDAETTVTIV